MPIYTKIDTSLFTVNGLKPEQIHDALDSWGVVVVTDVYTRDQCSEFLADYIPRSKLILDRMSTPKPGQHKDIICQDPALWKFRNDPKLRALYSYLYGRFHNTERYPHVLPSIDGVNIKDPTNAPFFNPDKPDWVHVDQTNGGLYDCIQGQIVLSDTSAGFVCSPKSHLVYNEVMESMHIQPGNKTNWCMISGKATPQQEHTIKEAVVAAGGIWQGYVYAPPGSLILWLSTTIHSAKIADKPPKNMLNQNPMKLLKELKGWRAVIYLCFIMSDRMTPDQLDLRWSAMRTNQSMNHWCDTIWKSYSVPSYNKDMMNLLANSTSWKHYDSKLIDEIITAEKQELADKETYHNKISDILNIIKST